MSQAGERFSAIFRFCKDLSDFERDETESHLRRVKRLVSEWVIYYRILKDLHYWKKEDKLDDLHKRLFRYMFRLCRYEHFLIHEIASGHYLRHVFEDLEKMGLPTCLKENYEDFWIFREVSFDLKPLKEELGFSEEEIEEVNDMIRERFDTSMVMLRERGVFPTILEGVKKIDELWRKHIEELIEEGFLEERFKAQNPGSIATFKRILIIGAGGFLIGHNLVRADPPTVATGVIAIASQIPEK